jgi:hypothetical protein
LHYAFVPFLFLNGKKSQLLHEMQKPGMGEFSDYDSIGCNRRNARQLCRQT